MEIFGKLSIYDCGYSSKKIAVFSSADNWVEEYNDIMEKHAHTVLDV